MKWIFLLVIIAAIAVYFVYLRPPAPQPLAAETPTPAFVPAVPGQPASTLAPLAVPEKHIAPKGTYFLLQAASITTDSGVVGIDVGTKVTVVNDKAKSWRVTDGQNQFDIAPANLTDDLDIAAAVVQKDAEVRAAYAAGIRDQQESDRKAREQGAAWLARQLELQRQQQLQQQKSTLQPQSNQLSQPATTGAGGTPPPFGRPGP